MKSKTKISKQLQRKTNPVLVETILMAKKHSAWMPLSSILSGPRVGFSNINIQDINSLEGLKDNEIVVVPGKVLSQGNLDKKIKVAALSFSEKAKEKLKGSCSLLIDEIKKNPGAKGIKIVKKNG